MKIDVILKIFVSSSRSNLCTPNFWAGSFPAASKMNFLSKYSSILNRRRPTFIQNWAQNGRATLKNCTTLISSAPCRDVCDA